MGGVSGWGGKEGGGKGGGSLRGWVICIEYSCLCG